MAKNEVVIHYRAPVNTRMNGNSSYTITASSIDDTPIYGEIDYDKNRAYDKNSRDVVFNEKVSLNTSTSYTLHIYPADKIKNLEIRSSQSSIASSYTDIGILLIQDNSLLNATSIESLTLSGVVLPDNFIANNIACHNQLKHLYINALPGSTIDLCNISGLTNLIELYILSGNNISVHGNLNNIRSLSKLNVLWLHSKSIYGDICQLAPLANLDDLSFYNCSILGDVKQLRHLKNLCSLTIYSTSIVGHVNVLSELPKLKVLTIDNTGISGSYIDIHKNSALDVITIKNCNVECQLSECSMLPELFALYLNNTKSTGSIDELRNCIKLESIDVANTAIDGDASSLNHLPRLQFFDYHRSNVYGQWKNESKFTNKYQLDKARNFLNRIYDNNKKLDAIRNEINNGMYNLKDIGDESLQQFKEIYSNAMDKYVKALDQYKEASDTCKQIIINQIKS